MTSSKHSTDLDQPMTYDHAAIKSWQDAQGWTRVPALDRVTTVERIEQPKPTEPPYDSNQPCPCGRMLETTRWMTGQSICGYCRSRKAGGLTYGAEIAFSPVATDTGMTHGPAPDWNAMLDQAEHDCAEALKPYDRAVKDAERPLDYLRQSGYDKGFRAQWEAEWSAAWSAYAAAWNAYIDAADRLRAECAAKQDAIQANAAAYLSRAGELARAPITNAIPAAGCPGGSEKQEEGTDMTARKTITLSDLGQIKRIARYSAPEYLVTPLGGWTTRGWFGFAAETEAEILSDNPIGWDADLIVRIDDFDNGGDFLARRKQS